MKFDPITKKKRISSLEEIINSGNYLEIPAEDGRNPNKVEQEQDRD